MRKMFCGVLIACVLAGTATKAETILGGQSGGILTYLDAPTHGASVSAPFLHFDGWAFNCYTGNVPTSIFLYRWDGTNMISVPVTTYVVSRHDVATVYQSYCPNIWDGVGIMVYPNSTEPVGYNQYYLFISDSSGTVVLAQEVNVTN